MIMSIDFPRTLSPIGGGGGFLPDPFLDLNSALTTPAIQKSTKSEQSPCLTNGSLAGAIIATLILSAFIGFLTWLVYLRPKFQELQLNQKQHHRFLSTPSMSNYRKQQIDNDRNTPQLPLDVTDYKFGTYPFRQSQTSSINGHYNRTDWLNRISSSFRSVNVDQDSEMLDIELLEPSFSGLNFSITGNMRAGIFVKEILDKGQSKPNSSNQLKAGDRIVALTVCFESIVYEDALTILSYASPYPVILRVQRPTNSTKVHVSNEKRTTTAQTINNKVKWRDDFEHYDNDTSIPQSFVQPNPPAPPPIINALPSMPTNSKNPSSPPQNRTPSSSKKVQQTSTPQSRHTHKSSTTPKGNKIKTSSTSILPSSVPTPKRLNNHNQNNVKKSRSKIFNQQRTMLMSTDITSKPPPVSTNNKTVKSVADAVISYLHYKGGGGGGENSTDLINHSQSAMMPYYDSPYDYYYGGQISQYQYLHQSHLNKNNNNSTSTESLTGITPNPGRSVYTLKFSSTKSSHPYPRRCQRRLSSPAIILSSSTEVEINDRRNFKVNRKNISLENIDTSV